MCVFWLDFFIEIDCFHAGEIASADATKGQWKQTKSVSALWKPSDAPSRVSGLVLQLGGTNGVPLLGGRKAH